MRIKEKSQWRKSAAIGVFSSSLLETLAVFRSLLLTQLKGVCMSLAMIRDQGRTPSFAISCLTDSEDKHFRPENPVLSRWGPTPLEETNVTTMIFPKLENAINPATIFCTSASSPKI